MGNTAIEAGEAMNILIKKNQLRNVYQITLTPCSLSLRERARVRDLTYAYGSHASRGNSLGDDPASRTAERFRLHSHAKRRNDAKRQNVGWVEQSEAQQNQIVGFHYIKHNLPFTSISRTEISSELALTTSGVTL
ncbi:hypothetical protein A1359_14260 [Methylomonas lenta]|uniref:Uncharacterized protein n=1 Tax=Methylomonas lenta TaxID=980561 RepID=A0A177N462_9GAMM|nr:hypothetical protein A1359_14260 [Methylomonas lenta]